MANEEVTREAIEALGERVAQFAMLELPGQPQAMHMGTSYLVNDLWQAVRTIAASQSRPTKGVAPSASGRGMVGGGYVLVPREPTEEMCEAGGTEFLAGVNNHETGTPTERPFRRFYKAMLASAPAPSPDNGGLPKSLSDYTDAEISREHHWRAVKKLGDPSKGVSLPPPPAQGGGK